MLEQAYRLVLMMGMLALVLTACSAATPVATTEAPTRPTLTLPQVIVPPAKTTPGPQWTTEEYVDVLTFCTTAAPNPAGCPGIVDLVKDGMLCDPIAAYSVVAEAILDLQDGEADSDRFFEAARDAGCANALPAGNQATP